MSAKWQPISTAPKDGTKILIFEAQEGAEETVKVSCWRNDTIPTGWTESEHAPRLWLPLPLPPDSAKPASKPMAAGMELESRL